MMEGTMSVILEGMIAQLEARARNMGEMMRRLGLEPGEAVTFDMGRSLEAAARSCSACGAVEECSTWLCEETGPMETAPSFCPNATRFREIARNL
jgi:hypothetical protein